MPFDFSFGIVVIWALSLWAGGVVKGVTGLGLPLVALPFLTMIFPVPFSVSMLAMPMVLSNVYLVVTEGRDRIEMKRFSVLLQCMVGGVFVGTWFLSSVEGTVLFRLLGSLVILFSLLNLSGFRPTIPKSQERYLGPIVGALAGLLGGATTLGGPVLVPYLSTLGLSPNTFVGTIAFLYLVLVSSLTIALASFGVMGQVEFLFSIAAVVPALLGLWIGARIREKVSTRAFLICVDMVLLGMGVILILRA